MSLSAQHIQANRLDLLSRLAGDISHEIKNPLHAMVINLELVRRKVEKGETSVAIERVAIVEDEIRKLHALANALLEALRPARDSQTAANFCAILDEMMPLVGARARLARVDLASSLEPSQLMVAIPAQDLRLLLLNVADRAVRSAGAGGAIDLSSTADGDAASLRILSAAPLLDDTEQAWLRDAPADVEHIDLGLRVVRDLVERAHGRIDVGSAEDRRSSLAITLPRAPSA